MFDVLLVLGAWVAFRRLVAGRWAAATWFVDAAGVLENLSGQWSGDVTKPDRYSLQGRAKGLHLAPSPAGGGGVRA